MIALESEIVTVFVYLNAPPPAYVVENLRRFNFLFPERPVLYVTNINVEFPTDIDVKVVVVDTAKFNVLFRNHTLSSKFRNGFWQSSLLRLMILSEIHEITPMSGLLHIEADVVLMPDFPLEKLARQDKLMWNGFNEDTDVAALLYSPDPTSTRHLVSYITKDLESNSTLTDMKALANYRMSYPSNVELFPSDIASPNFKEFNCLFDGANYGMWLLGQDQRNHFGYLVRFKDLDECEYRVGESKFRYGAKGLTLALGEYCLVSLVNLHVHCKDSRIFESSDSLLKKRVSQSNSYFKFPIFSILIFLRLFISAIRDGELKGFLLHLPVAGRILKFIRSLLSSLNN